MTTSSETAAQETGAPQIVQEARYRISQIENLQDLNHLRSVLEKIAGNEAISPEETQLAREDCGALEQNIEALPPKCRYALLMVRMEGASDEEVAKRLGIETGSVSLLVERAMEYLLEKKRSMQSPRISDS